MIPFSAHEIQIPLRHLARSGDTVFDVGAHQGWVAGPLAQLVGPKGLVVCFEPTPVNIDTLRDTLVREGIANVAIVPAAAYHTSGETMTFYQNPLPQTSSFYIRAGEGYREIEVQTITLDDYLDLTGASPAIVKIDVEGAEYDVLKGAPDLIARRPFFLLETQRADPRPFQILKAAGYRAFNLFGYQQIHGDEEFAAGRPVEDLIYFPEGRDAGPFGRDAPDYAITDVRVQGADVWLDVPLKAGINCVRIWGTAPDPYQVLEIQAVHRNRIVVNSADQLGLCFNPYYPCVIYASQDEVARFHFWRRAAFTIERVGVKTIPLTDSEHRRHMLLAVTVPFGIPL